MYSVKRTKENELKHIKKLTFKPKVKYGWPKPVQVYKLTEDKIYLPRYYVFDVLKFKKIKEQQIDPINLNFNGKLYDYQTNAINEILKCMKVDYGGILNAQTGTGKTIMCLYLIAKLKVRTIIIVHKEFLMEQWESRIKEFIPEATIGVVRGSINTSENKDITLAMLQTVSTKEFDYTGIGFLIVDECHCINSYHFSKALFNIYTKYRLGLSATPHREDGLDRVLTCHFGKIITSIENSVIIPCVEVYISDVFVDFELNKKDLINLPKLITDLSESEERNEILVEIIEKYKSRNIIIFSDRINHCKKLSARFENSSIFAGKMSKDQRQQAMEKNIIFCTYSMAKEGFDLPKLDVLVFATPKINIKQCIGRILRKKHNQQPIVVDIKDVKIGPLMSQFYKRTRYYKDNSYNIELK